MQVIAPSTQINNAVARLDAWFETMRGPGGYGGPVAHWWQQSLLFTGPGLDWRYEGIIAGYLNLWERSGETRWLKKAVRAGDDLVSGQLDDGHFCNSAFEINPATAGTPHEAACDVGLLQLALALKELSDPSWQIYFNCARRNLESFYLGKLWDVAAQSFRDAPLVSSFVPNKAATACEAFFLLAEITQDSTLIEKYVMPNLDKIIEHQLPTRAGFKLEGAVAQNSFGPRKIEKYFPIYNARCIPALVMGYNFTKKERYLASAIEILDFISRWLNSDGTIPTVIYANGRISSYPLWISPLGDILRAAAEFIPFGIKIGMDGVLARILAGQDNSGGIQTATGFASQAGGRLPTLPDVRDILHVAGWCDKAFRYLTTLVEPTSGFEITKSLDIELECIFQSTPMRSLETPEKLEIRYQKNNRVCYLWQKGKPWAEIVAPEFWLK